LCNFTANAEDELEKCGRQTWNDLETVASYYNQKEISMDCRSTADDKFDSLPEQEEQRPLKTGVKFTNGEHTGPYSSAEENDDEHQDETQRVKGNEETELLQSNDMTNADDELEKSGRQNRYDLEHSVKTETPRIEFTNGK